jgi:hypothetical protein
MGKIFAASAKYSAYPAKFILLIQLNIYLVPNLLIQVNYFLGVGLLFQGAPKQIKGDQKKGKKRAIGGSKQ